VVRRLLFATSPSVTRVYAPIVKPYRWRHSPSGETAAALQTVHGTLAAEGASPIPGQTTVAGMELAEPGVFAVIGADGPSVYVRECRYTRQACGCVQFTEESGNPHGSVHRCSCANCIRRVRPATHDRETGRFRGYAASPRAKLNVFPEALVGRYPEGLDFGTSVGSRTSAGCDTFRIYYEGAIEVPSALTAPIGRSSASAGTSLETGVVGREGRTLDCSVLLFAPRVNEYMQTAARVNQPTVMYAPARELRCDALYQSGGHAV
jgi:hypothetical protein